MRGMRTIIRNAIHLSLPESHAAAAAFTPPEWVHLIPAGTFSGRDGRGPYHLDAESVLAAFTAGGIDLPFDYDHQSLSADDKAGPVPAAGWIKELQAREDGLFGRVEWTPRAVELLANREYRYVSPVFRVDERGRVLALLGAGLTHTPNLELTPVVQTQGDAMTLEDLMERLIAVLNLPAATTPDELAAHLDKLVARLSAAEAAASQARQLNPAEWVPMSQHKAVADELAQLQADVAAGKAEAAVAAAMSAGKLAPAMKGWAIEYARRDPQGFAAFVAAAPVVVASARAGNVAGNVASNADTLTDEDRYVAAALGIAESDFAAHKKTIIKE